MVYRNSIVGRLIPLLLLTSLLALTGCGNNYSKQLQSEYSKVEKNLVTLEGMLYSRQLTNAKIVDIYAKKLAQIKPDFRPIAESMADDSTERGVLYTGLVKRLEKVNREPENKQQFQQAHQSLVSIDIAADPVVFNDALLDLINTMAELSDGQLETVSIPKDSQMANVRGETVTPGSYLVGNPSYGEYRQNSSGSSMWHWYGQYAFFSSLMRGGLYNQSPIYYNDWNRRPRYSYYNDYGRNTYGSQSDRNQTRQRNNTMRDQGYTPAKPRKQYGSVKGRQRVSTYAQQKSTQSSHFTKKYGSSNSGARHADKTNNKRSSSYFSGNKSSSNKSQSVTKRRSSFFGSSSARNSSRSYSGSRSFGGK
jgi:hypothetical protein